MRAYVIAAVLVAALALSGSAWGKCGHGVSKKINPAVREYVEIIPTACGPKTKRVGSGEATLPRSVEQELSNGSVPEPEAAILKKVGSSESAGAPQRKITSDARTRSREPAGRSPLEASVSAVAGGTDGRLLALLVVMGLIVLVVAGMAAYRRRVSR